MKICLTCKHDKRTQKDPGVIVHDCRKGCSIDDLYDVLTDRWKDCPKWEEKKPTNADMIRKMSDEELLEELYRIQGNATACVECWKKNGKERLRLFLETEARNG